MYVSLHIDMYMYVIVLSLPPAALQFKKKNIPEWEKKKKEAILANVLHLLQLSLSENRYFPWKKDRKEEFWEYKANFNNFTLEPWKWLISGSVWSEKYLKLKRIFSEKKPYLSDEQNYFCNPNNISNREKQQ